MKPKAYNRNLIGGKRPHKGITNMPNDAYFDLNKRFLFETSQLQKYINRVKNQKPHNIF